MNNQVRESLKKILAASEEGKLGAMNYHGGCMYKDENTGKCCAIGCLLTEEQLEKLDYVGIMSAGIDDMEYHFPGMLSETTGFTKEQASALQSWHDECYGKVATITKYSFEEMLNNLLEGWILEIRTCANPAHLGNDTVCFSNVEDIE